MEQKITCEDVILFGEANIYIATSTTTNKNDTITQSSNVRSPSTEQETHTVNNNDRHRVNYGPCKVCHVKKACILFIGCNHLACCGQCSERCESICPVENCGQPILGRLRVFEPM